MRFLLVTTVLLALNSQAAGNKCVNTYATIQGLPAQTFSKSRPSISVSEIADGGIFNRSWHVAKDGILEFHPTGDTRFLSHYRRLRGDYRLPTIGLDMTFQTSAGSHKIAIYAMTGYEKTLHKMAAILKQLPPVFLKTLDTIELWPTSEYGDFTVLGNGFLLQDPPPGTLLGEAIKIFGQNGIQTYGQTRSILPMTGARPEDKLLLKISSDLVSRIGMSEQEKKSRFEQTTAEVKHTNAWGAQNDPFRREEILKNIAHKNAIAELLDSMADQAFYQMTETQRNEYADIVRKDERGLPFNSDKEKDWTWQNLQTDFRLSLIKITKQSRAENSFEKDFPNRFAFMKKLFGYSVNEYL